MMIQTRRNPRRGTVLVLVVISLTVLLMVLGFSIDGGLLLTERRKVQAAADAAALAGAADLYKRYGTNKGIDPSPYYAQNGALAIAKSNGYDPAAGDATVEVRTEGATYLGGPKQGQVILPSFIEVTITFQHPRYFSALMGEGKIPVSARAVACGKYSPAKFGILALEPHDTGLTLNGNGNVTVAGDGAVIINSDGGTKAPLINNGASDSDPNFYAPELDIYPSAGSISEVGLVVEDVNYNQYPTPDPLAYLPPPTEPAINGSVTKITTPANISAIIASLTAAGVTLPATITTYWEATPGLYEGTNPAKFPPSLGSSDLVLFHPGIYYLKDYGPTLTNSALLMYPGESGGMMFYIDPSSISDGLTITGNGENPVNLLGMQDGIYKGIIIFQDRTGIQPPITITGNGNFTMQGVIYAANGDLKLTGNGSGNIIGSALIAQTVTLGGNGEITVNFTTDDAPLVRILRLVE